MNETTLPRVTPYRGEEPYIFISYCHKDSARVLPILAELISRGYRIWYDEGIDPGTEWDEMIATRLMDSAYFIPFITENYLASENCMDELHLAREETLRRFLVYLEEVNLPPAQRMRLGRIQNIHKYTYQNDADFYNKFTHADGLSVCRNTEQMQTSEPLSNPTDFSKLEKDSIVFQKEEPKQAVTLETVPNATDFEINQNGCLTKYTGPGGDVVIPDGVTVIGSGAFSNCKSLTSIIIPNSVTKISWYAFRRCTNLTSIIIPSSVTEIGAQAFFCCTKLTSITITGSRTKIGLGAFSDCESLTIHAPAGSYAIKYATENSIRFVADDTLDQHSITSQKDDTKLPVMIAEDVSNPNDFEIDQNGCLTKYTGPGGDVVIPDGVTEIGESAFENCTSLTSVTIPDGVTEIGSHTFCGCTGLVSITIPKSITQIGSFSFLSCKNLTSITMPDSVTKIGGCAFLGCTSLTIHAPSESYAIKYAIENYIRFVTE